MPFIKKIEKKISYLNECINDITMETFLLTDFVMKPTQLFNDTTSRPSMDATNTALHTSSEMPIQSKTLFETIKSWYDYSEKELVEIVCAAK